MSHLVIFTSADNTAGFEPCDDLKSAAAAVERLRNDQGVENARIFRLEEVKFEVKTYYKIEVAEAEKANPAVKAIEEPPIPVAPDPVVVALEPDMDAPAAAVSSVASEMATLIAAQPIAAPAAAIPVPAASTIDDIEEFADLEASAMGQRRGLFGR